MAVLLLLGGVGAACKAKGNGIGTAPIDIPCPDVRPTAASPCPDPQHVGTETNVCPYPGTCADPAATGESFFFCPGGTNAAWKCIDATEAGPQDASTDAADGETTDAEAGETDLDATDAGETDLDATDDGETTTDDALDGETLDGSLDADDADALAD